MKWESYEISLWSHQETYLATLCNSLNFRKYDANSPVLNCSTTGLMSLTFSIPIKCYNLETGQLDDNTIWYNSLIKSKTLANEKRVKLIFDKTLSSQRIMEFVITTMELSRNGEELLCNVTCSGLAFKWLGKIGFDITLDSDTMLLLLEDDDVVLTPTINYWLDKVFPRDDDGNWLTFWRYRIEMNYVGYVGTRDSDKVYEDDDVISWKENADTSLTPVYNTEPIEKQRFISVEESNKYNITQDIAELFEIFARYEFLYEDTNNPYKATAGVVVFYNLQVQETLYVISYGNNETGLTKTSESSDIVTKMYVDPVEDEYSDSGYVSLSEADGNKMGELYLFNFDYYIEAGEMTSVQQSAIATYEASIRKINQQISEISTNRDDIYNQITDDEVTMNNAKDSMTSAQDLVKDYNDKLSIITSQITGDASNMSLKVLLMVHNDGLQYYVSLTRNGIKPDTITSKTEGIDSTSWTVGKDQFGFANKLTFGDNPGNSITIEYYYDALGFYTKIVDYYTGLANTAENTYTRYKNLIGDSNDIPNENGTEYAKYNYWKLQYKTIADTKELLTRNFEELMGYFIKLGKWDASDFSVSYLNKTITSPTSWNCGYNAVGFYNSVKDSEIKSYYLSGSAKTKVYYDYIDLDQDILQNITDYSTFTILLTWTDAAGTARTNYYTNGAHGSIQFLKINYSDTKYWVIPIFMFENTDRQVDSKHQLSYRYSSDSDVYNIAPEHYHRVASSAYPDDFNVNATLTLGDDSQTYTCSAAGTIVFRRMPIDDTNISDTSITINKVDGIELTEYEDYLYYKVDDIKTVTFKIGNTFPVYLDNTVLPLTLHYKQDHSSQQLYYDAKDVLETSAFPEVTYEVEFSYLRQCKKYKLNLDIDNNDTIDLDLGCIVRINDWGLNLNNVKGIVNEFQIDLDSPQNTTFTISNYKTRFEDLFGRIVAETQSMLANVASYNRAASAITATGEITASILQSTISNNSLIFSSGYNSAITWDENGIIVENTTAYANGVTGQVVIKGGGILLSNSMDANGNRLYTSAITPNGINASALTVGRIDTEKINVYSGDQIRFMWNAEGLFAYADDKVDELKGYITSYICYNEDGLIFYENSTPTVSLTWDGLYIGAQDGAVEIDGTNGLTMYNGPKYDNEGNEITDRIVLLHVGRYEDKTRAIYYGFRLFDEQGNSTLVTDNSGVLWLKDKLEVGNGNSMSGISALGATTYTSDNKVDSSPVRFWAGASYDDRVLAPFWVLEDGTLHATNAYIEGLIHATSGEFSGKISATEGSIGGWTINETSISSNGIELTSGDDAKISVSGDNGTVTIGKNGTLSATGVNISGTINASGGNIGNLSVADINAASGKYFVNITSSKGFTTKDGAKLTTELTATVQNGLIMQDSTLYTYQWQYLNDGIWTQLTTSTANKITQDIEITDEMYIRCIATNSDSTITITSDECHFINVASASGAAGKDGKDAVSVLITSSKGAYFRNNNGTTILSARIFKGGQLVDTDGTQYKYVWHTIDSITELGNTKTITVSADDVDFSSTYMCDIYEPS